MRSLYEPYAISLARYLSLTVPGWFPDGRRADNWQTTAWEKSPVAVETPEPDLAEEEHF